MTIKRRNMCNTLCTLVIIILPHPLVRHTHVPFLSSRALLYSLAWGGGGGGKKSNAAFAEELTKDRERIFMGFSVLFPSRKFLFSLESQYYFTTYEEVHSINSKKQLKGRKKKKSVIILAASVLAAVGSHKKERKNISV